jgi:hypothetical protein
MKPTVSDRRNHTDVRALMLAHRGPRLPRDAALEAGQADIFQTSMKVHQVTSSDVRVANPEETLHRRR